MELVEVFKNQLADWQSASQTNPSSLVINIVTLMVVVRILKPLITFTVKVLIWPITLFSPIDYKLDMTTKAFCKTIAEVDNKLARQFSSVVRKEVELTAHDSVNSNGTIGKPLDASDCTTDLLEAKRTQTCDDKQRTTISGDDRKIENDEHLHVYPNGWLPLMESTRVKPGTIERAILMGRDLIVTRSIEGKVDVLDAYCPHIGVHIGVGGRVVRIENQSCVQCPFHGWTFRASDGQCVHIPYMKNQSKCAIPKQAKLDSWQSTEIDNFIYIWHHIDGQPPNWFLTQTNELLLKDWALVGRSSHKSNLEIRDMLENGADLNHFEGIHNNLFVFGGDFLKVQGYDYLQHYFRHHWSPNWQPILNEDGKATHMAEMNLQSWVSFFKLRIFDIRVHATQIGPASVSLRYDSKWYGKGILKMNAIPLGGRRTKYIQHMYTQRSIKSWIMAKWVLYGEIMQLERDFFIWNHKKNIRNPIFIPDDKILKKFRLWYSQFYKRKRHIKIVDESENDNKHYLS